jgi:preprotein translocase subunit YajC
MFITPAYAQAAGGASGGFDLISLMPLVLIFVVFYFLLIRPQQKRAKEHKLMVANLRRGDQVVTGGGILGKVTRVKDGEEVEVEIAEGTRVRVYRSSITGVLSKSEPVKDKPAKDK